MDLHIIVCAGLANRLRAFVSACCWAQHTKRNLRITWPVGNMDCNAKFQDLFQVSTLPSWIRIDLGPILTKPHPIYSEDDMKAYITSGIKQPIESYSRFWMKSCELWKQSLQYLQPHPSLGIVSGVKENWVGVHIRRGDHTFARRYSPLTLFIPQIKEALLTGSHVFIASDDSTELQEIHKYFNSHHHLHLSEGWIGGRGSRQGIQNAVRDIWTLAQCGKGILGSYQSSFGEFASWIYDIPLKILHSE